MIWTRCLMKGVVTYSYHYFFSNTCLLLGGRVWLFFASTLCVIKLPWQHAIVSFIQLGTVQFHRSLVRPTICHLHLQSLLVLLLNLFCIQLMLLWLPLNAIRGLVLVTIILFDRREQAGCHCCWCCCFHYHFLLLLLFLLLSLSSFFLMWDTCTLRYLHYSQFRI